MATEKTLKTRIVQKIDTLSNWESSTLPLKEGEIALATTTVNGQNIILAKIGTGAAGEAGYWKNTPYNFYANAADISGWGRVDEIGFSETNDGKVITFYYTTYKSGQAVKTPVGSVNIDHTHAELDSLVNTVIPGIKNYTVTGSDGLTGSGRISENPVIKHAVPTDYKSMITGGSEETDTFVTGVVRDKFGHITDVTTGKVTVPELPEISITTTDDNIVDLTASAEGHSIAIDAKHKKYYGTDPDAVGAVKGETITANGNEVKFLVPNIDVDEYGHVEGVDEHEISITIPEIPDLSVIKGANTSSPTGDTIEVVTAMSESPSEHKITYTTADMPTKEYVDNKLGDLKGELEEDIENLHVNITDKPNQDDLTKGYVYAVTNLEEDNSGAHNIVPTYTKIATFEQVEKLAAGAVDYLGTVSTQAELDAKVSIASHGDFVRVIINANSGVFGETYCTGDLLIYNKADKDTAGVWDLIHGELDKDTWEANDTNTAGYVAAPGTGKSGYVWKVGSDDKPAWLPDANDDTNTNSTYDISVAEVSSETAEVTFLEKIKNEITGTTTDGESEKIKIRAAGDNKIEVDAANKLIIITGTDEKVTSAANHYEPTKDTSKTIDVDAAANTTAAWGTTSMVTGVTVERDSKGHVTNVSLDSVKMPVNPDTNTTYDLSAKNGGTNTADIDLTAGGSGSGTDTVKVIGGENVTVSVNNNNEITISSSYIDTDTHFISKNIVANTATATTNAADTTGTETTDDLTTPNVTAGNSKYKKYDIYLNHVETLDNTNNITSTHKISAINGLKVTSDTSGNMEFGIDDDIVFVFDCGDASSY